MFADGTDGTGSEKGRKFIKTHQCSVSWKKESSKLRCGWVHKFNSGWRERESFLCWLPQHPIKSFIRSCRQCEFLQFLFKTPRDKISTRKWSDRRISYGIRLMDTEESHSSALFWVLNVHQPWNPFRLRLWLCFVSWKKIWRLREK